MIFDKRAKIILSLVCIFVLLVIGAAAFTYLRLEKMAKESFGDRTGVVIYEIAEGSSKDFVANDLSSKNYIKSKFVFSVFSRLNTKPFKTGYFEIPASVSVFDLIRYFTTGENEIYKITIPEGWRRDQIARALRTKGIADESEFLSASLGHEGKLYPSTYYIKPNTSAADIVAKMTEEYTEKTSGMNVSQSDLILASIVERETDKAEEKPIIAGIYKNRLRIDMKLQADPTGIYANDTRLYGALDQTAKKDYKFWTPISISVLNNLNSEFNTYYYYGLPPEPICNPSVETITAVQHYEKNDYLFFQHVGGTFYPAKTYAEHVANGKK